MLLTLEIDDVRVSVDGEVILLQAIGNDGEWSTILDGEDPRVVLRLLLDFANQHARQKKG